MNVAGTLLIEKREYVIIPRAEYERLTQSGQTPPKLGKERPAKAAIHEIIAKTLLESRIRAGLSQEELARKAGVRSETISRIESGKFRPRRETMARLDKALGR
jgi:ribosome-binding protein aMBF1 (putative translation factor)